jgi:hypothetical protein
MASAAMGHRIAGMLCNGTWLTRMVAAAGVVAALAQPLAGQNVSLTISVYSNTPYLSDWEAKAGTGGMTVTNTTGVPVDVTVTAELRRNGVSVGQAGSDITQIPVGGRFYDLPLVARWGRLSLQGSVASSVKQSGRLPEGSYQLCVNFTNMSAAGRQIADVQGCTLFQVSFPQPPRLLAPANGTTVAAPFPTFQWTPVITPTANQVGYLVRVVEMLPGQTPQQALLANVPIYEHEYDNVTSFLYPPAAFPLEGGKHYAWRVRAITATSFVEPPPKPVGANNGYSEIFTFTRGAAPGAVVTVLPSGPPKPGGGGGPTYVFQPPLFNSTLSGRLEYTMTPGSVPAPARVKPFTALTYPTMQYGPGGTPPPPPFTPIQIGTMGTAPHGGHAIAGLPSGGPLAGVTVKLVVRYRSGVAPVNASSVRVGTKTYDDVGQVLATATTDANGHFTFLFHDDDATGQVAFFQPISWGSGDIGTHAEAQGVLFRYYNVDVEDAHYLSPSDELTLPPSRQGDVGKLVSLVRTYRLVVRVLDSKSNQALPGVTVRLLRRQRPPLVPKYEGTLPLPRPIDTSFVFALAVHGEILADSATSTAGSVEFSRLVKNAGPSDAYVVRAFTPLNQPGLYYFPDSKGYAKAWTFQAGGGFVQRVDNAHYNEQYDTQLIDTLTIHLQARPPRIAGHVLRSDNGQGVAKGIVIIKRGTSQQLAGLRLLQAKDSGRFAVDNLPAGTGYTVYAGATGFLPETKTAGELTLGHQWYAEWLLDPDARVRARFVDDLGTPVAASIKFGDGPYITAQATDYKAVGGFGNVKAIMPTAMGVDTFATSGTITVQIEAEPDHFAIDTTLTLHTGANDLGTFVLQRRLHRVRVRVVRGNPMGGLSLPGAPPVVGAHVQLDQAQQSDGTQGTSGNDGVVTLWWKSVGQGGAGDSTANLQVVGPPNQDWVPQGRSCTAPETPTPPTCVVHLRPGTRVTGTVYQGPGTDTPVGAARISLPQYDGIDATTDAQGKFDLRSVPRWVTVVRAGKAGSGLVGDSAIVKLTAATATGVDFHLKPGGGMASLYGFPLEIATATPAPGGDGFIVTGSLTAPANPAFAPVDAGGTALKSVALPFDQIRLRPASGDPAVAVPAGDSVSLATGELALGLLGKYRATQRGALTQLVVRDRGQNHGAVFGPVELLRKESFQGTTSTGLSFVDAQGKDAPLYLLQPDASGAARTALATLTADAASPAPADGLNVGSRTGGAAQFRLATQQGQAGFPVDADPGQSVVRADGVHFKATLHTAIDGIGDLKLQIPTLLLQPGTGGLTAATTDTIAMALGQWTLRVTNWSLSDAGVYFTKGEIRAPLVAGKPQTAVVFPFTGMQLLPTALSGGTIQSGAVTLGGVVSLVPDGPLSFAREGLGPWKIWAQGGTISGLPAWRSSDAITLDNWSLRSNGDNHFTTAPATVRLYHTADFAVTGLGVADGTVTFTGSLDLLAPPEGKIPPLGVDLYYSKDPQGQISFAMDKATWPEIDIGGAFLKIADGQLDASGFHAGGHIRIPDYFTVATNFSRTPLTGTNTIAAVPTPDATIAIGQLALTQVKGGATLASPWSTAFQAVLDLPNEVQGPMSFKVAGAGVTVGSAGLTVKNFATPFGNMAITLNMPEQRLEGSVQLNQQLAAGATASGTAQLAISGKPSNRYWYFFAGANFQLSNPTLGGTAALLIGNATLTGDLLKTFASYSTKGVPPSFHTIKGFFLDGKVVVPVPVCPSGGVDVGVASVAVWCDVWGDLRLGMNFAEQNLYHIGLQGGVDVGAKGGVSLGACVSVSGEAKYAEGIEGEYRSDGAWYVLGDASFDLHGEVEYGVGAFGVCLSNSSGFTLGLGAEAQMGNNWNTGKGPHFTVYWK